MVRSPALGPARIFTDSAVSDGPVGQWVYTVTGLTGDLGGHGLCGTAAALWAYSLGHTQPLMCGQSSLSPVWCGGSRGLGALVSHISEHNLFGFCALQEGRRSSKVPAL